mmetsp:Transcript_15787/g.18214  ORF Transcript_15787/g.18214 Transcript_15787/m.18214 type:complete len:83 (+) Transcript_15787:602-850(+)
MVYGLVKTLLSSEYHTVKKCGQKKLGTDEKERSFCKGGWPNINKMSYKNKVSFKTDYQAFSDRHYALACIVSLVISIQVPSI